MKRFFVVLVIVCLIPMNSFANTYTEEEYEKELSNYDFGAFDKTLDSQTTNILNELGINDFDVTKLTNLSLSDFIDIIKSVVYGKVQLPLKAGIEILIFILLSTFIQSFKDNFDSSLESVYSLGSCLVLIIILITKFSFSFSLAASAIKLCSDFIYAFVPAFFVVIVSSGGVVTSVATNSFLLLLAQALTFISNTLFLPLVNSFLAIGICSSLNTELGLDKLIYNIKFGITKIISISSAIFVSILSIKTAVASRADALGLRSMRFAINSVVPVIGSAISEGLLSIQSYSQLIKTTVGSVAIIAIGLIFLPSIIEVTIWRLVLSFCCVTANVFDDRNVAQILGIFKDSFLLINVILILSMLTTIVSFGLLIATKLG